MKFRNPVVLSVIRHRLNHLESTSKKNVCLGEKIGTYIVTGDPSGSKGYCHIVCHVNAFVNRSSVVETRLKA
jgi:hypothetical protein